MKMYIPEIGDEIRLLADWTFGLYNESRNETLMEKVGDLRKTRAWGDDFGSIPCTIPINSVLKIDRIYIRKGNKEYSSITFLWKGEALPARMEEVVSYNRNSPFTEWIVVPTGKFVKIPRIPIRFWAKLSDVNNCEFERV